MVIEVFADFFLRLFLPERILGVILAEQLEQLIGFRGRDADLFAKRRFRQLVAQQFNSRANLSGDKYGGEAFPELCARGVHGRFRVAHQVLRGELDVSVRYVDREEILQGGQHAEDSALRALRLHGQRRDHVLVVHRPACDASVCQRDVDHIFALRVLRDPALRRQGGDRVENRVEAHLIHRPGLHEVCADTGYRAFRLVDCVAAVRLLHADLRGFRNRGDVETVCHGFGHLFMEGAGHFDVPVCGDLVLHRFHQGHDGVVGVAGVAACPPRDACPLVAVEPARCSVS